MYSIKVSKKTLKFGDVEVSNKEFHASKQAITLNLVDIDKIVMSDKNIVIKSLSILLTMKMIILLDFSALFYLKWVDT